MSEGEPEYSPEEEAEAYKINEMVDKGVISRAEAGQIEKDKTPEEFLAEREARNKAEEGEKE